MNCDGTILVDEHVVLVVAEKHVSEMLIEMFQGLRVLIYQSSTVDDAVASAELNRPDAVIIDGDLAGVDPVACSRIFKAEVALSNIPVIILASPECDRKPFLLTGCAVFLTKPLAPDSIFSLLRRYVTSSDRRNMRIPFFTPVTIQVNDENFYGLTGDISTGGLFIASFDRLPDQGDLRLSFKLVHKEPLLIEAQGRIAWINSKERSVSDSLPEGVGVEFVRVGPKELRAIRDYITAGRD